MVNRGTRHLKANGYLRINIFDFRQSQTDCSAGLDKDVHVSANYQQISSNLNTVSTRNVFRERLFLSLIKSHITSVSQSLLTVRIAIDVNYSALDISATFN